MSLTITIPGAVNVTTGATAPATLTVGVGTPGATGPQGPAGAGVPTGGTAGQFLTKIDGVSYNTDWVTLPAYAPLASPAFTGDPTAPTAALGDNDTSIATTAFVQQELASGTAVAKNLEVDVRNQSGSTIPAGAIVYISGATGNKPLITLAQANNDANSAQTFGFVKSAIANNATGHVIVRGELENIDTSALTEGVQLYLSPTTAGTWTTTKPSAPNHLVYVGIVVRSHPTLGVIEVAIQNGYELEELHNVAIASVADSDLLSYDSATTLWKNKSFSTLGLATQSWVTSQGYLTSSSLTGYAQLSGAIFTGEVATPASTTSSAGFSIAPGTAPTTPQNGEIWNTGSDIQVRLGGVTETLAEQSWVTTQLGSYLTTASAASTYQTQAGMSSYLTTSAASTTYAALAGATFTGLVSTPAATTASAFLRVAHGTAPSAPVNGDVWTTTSGLFARINGGTQQYAPLGSTNTFTGTNTFSGATVSFGTSTAASTINVGTGATLTATTKAINIGTAGVAGSTTNITIGNSISGATSTTTVAGTLNATGTSLDLGNSTAAATYNIANGVTTTGLTKAINIGNNGAAGSTTSIVIGQASGTSSTNIYGTVTLQGSAAATTLAADTNTTGIATTAFVVGQAGSATPLINGTAAVGTSLRYARQDHVHPTDTTRAALASPTFTGTPAAPTAAVDTNTTQIATTAYVVGQGYAKLASPTLTGTPAAPTAAVDTNTTQLATTAYVVGQGYLKSATASSTYAPLASPALTGTPTAPTATAGTNTTQIATTAFVLANAGATYATSVQSRAATSTTVAQNPSTSIWQVMNPGLIEISRMDLTYTATGTMGTTGQGFLTGRMTMGTVGAAGANFRTFGASQIDQSYALMSKGYRSYIDFSKFTWCSGRFYMENTPVDPLVTAAFYYGKANNSANGDLARAGFGWKLTGNATASLRNPILQVHNGTTLTNVTSSFAVVAQVYWDWDIISLGNGTVTLYINGTQVATTNAGPTADTSYSGTSPVIWNEELFSTGTTLGYDAAFGRGRIYVAP